MSDRAQVGAAGESAVARFFESKGYVVEARNWHCKLGELDLVVRQAKLIVFVEVRTVTTDWLGSPIETITSAKQARVGRAADAWLQSSDCDYDNLRFDVVGVRLRRMRAPLIEHLPNAFVPPWAW
ncbi:MAG: putative endonuclease [Bradymonadia bacterium]|jgi:putative endonuclease